MMRLKLFDRICAAARKNLATNQHRFQFNSLPPAGGDVQRSRLRIDATARAGGGWWLCLCALDEGIKRCEAGVDGYICTCQYHEDVRAECCDLLVGGHSCPAHCWGMASGRRRCCTCSACLRATRVHLVTWRRALGMSAELFCESKGLGVVEAVGGGPFVLPKRGCQ